MKSNPSKRVLKQCLDCISGMALNERSAIQFMEQGAIELAIDSIKVLVSKLKQKELHLYFHFFFF